MSPQVIFPQSVASLVAQRQPLLFRQRVGQNICAIRPSPPPSPLQNNLLFSALSSIIISLSPHIQSLSIFTSKFIYRYTLLAVPSYSPFNSTPLKSSFFWSCLSSRFSESTFSTTLLKLQTSISSRLPLSVSKALLKVISIPGRVANSFKNYVVLMEICQILNGNSPMSDLPTRKLSSGVQIFMFMRLAHMVRALQN